MQKLLVFALLAACSAEPAEKGDGPIVIGADAGADAAVEQPVITQGAVTITASTALEVARVGGMAAGAGKVMVVVPVSVANGLEEAIPVGYTLFRLRVDALEQLPSAASAELEVACPVDALLSAGTAVQCAVAFEIQEGGEPSALIFQALDETLETPVSFEACTKCDGACADLTSSEYHCGACNKPVPSGASCVDGTPTCPNGRYLCDGSCQSNDAQCYLSSTRQISCATICGAEGLQCVQVDYFYQCTENTFDSHPDLGCDDQPPRTWDACGTYTDMDCRCMP